MIHASIDPRPVLIPGQYVPRPVCTRPVVSRPGHLKRQPAGPGHLKRQSARPGSGRPGSARSQARVSQEPGQGQPESLSPSLIGGTALYTTWYPPCTPPGYRLPTHPLLHATMLPAARFCHAHSGGVFECFRVGGGVHANVSRNCFVLGIPRIRSCFCQTADLALKLAVWPLYV